MKILYVINQISDWSGDSSLLWLSAKFMKQRGHEVAIATTDGNPFKDTDSYEKYSHISKKLSNSSNSFVMLNDISIYPVHSVSSSFGMYSFNASNVAKNIVNNFDIVHIYSWYHHIGIEFFKSAKKHNIPIVFTAMGTLQKDAKSFYKYQKFIIDLFFTKKLITYASVLHSVGSSEIESYVQFGGTKDKIVQIENGIDLKDFKIHNPTGILQLLSIENKSYILYLGRIHPKKGVELLIDSFHKLSATHQELYLVIAGSGETSYVQNLKQLVRDLGLTDKVKFTGLVTHDEKLVLLKSAKLFSLLSRSDVHPRAVQEALTMGVPVIISEESDYPEVEEYMAGIIVNLDSDIVRAFTQLLHDDKLQEFSNNARKLIHDKFLVEDQISKFEKIYLDIISKNNY